MSTVLMFVNGQAMSGGSLNDALSEAELVGPAATAARYRFYSVRDEFPGLYPVESDGHTVRGELYRVSYRVLRDRLLPREPEELELSVIELDDGSGCLSMQLRDRYVSARGVTDISRIGDWRVYTGSPT
ncbi:allophanate hydrolase-related protein [Tsukamurella soli]|uniref:Gamma-glutamylcyclotransferase n=1 Tax=Tsukamurella soli TaxID=644556 RepID=A0ABP8KDZ6_9ACTN